MQVLKASPEAIAFALEILKLGGIVAHATETCYGLACDMTNREAVEKLFKVKNRVADQPVSALFPSIKASEEWVEWCPEALELAKAELPGPLTIILPIKESKCESVFPIPTFGIRNPESERRRTLGIRVSPHPIAIELAKQFGRPISTTSANISGEPSPYSVEEIQMQFTASATSAAESRGFPLREQPDLIIDSGTLENKPPSKVVLFEDGEMRVLRS
ncbi:threonylcarbamoyl-AMP synthase [Patescibacteria group bacterium]|nr:threonylcarbamoyl-AMP synthase [Patescibacteria group bacterium]MBU1124061.1 threonylcarbamoyl-AMP synthase [Patescibacteria group bacterium]MBU1911783.1 threonylcarbamoyl-AMP synthase [Patescibacteria group bacterium]